MDGKFNWIDTGPYYDENPHIHLMACCYTQRDGRKIKSLFLIYEEDLESDIPKCESQLSNRAVDGGAWTPKGEQTNCKKELHEILFAPWPVGSIGRKELGIV